MRPTAGAILGLESVPSWTVLCALLVAQACAGDTDAVGRLTVRPAEIRLGYPHLERLRLRWEPSRALDRLHGRPLVFLHLLDARGRLVRALDHELPSEWRPGSPQAYETDLAQSALDAPLPSGDYRLTAGLYDSAWGYRWPLQVEGGTDLGRREYLVATVGVDGDVRDRPSFTFAGGWLPLWPGPRAGSGRRRMKAAGTLTVGGLAPPGAVVLELSVAGAPATRLEVFHACPFDTGHRLGPGRHRVEVAVAVGTTRECAIEVAPAAEDGGEIWLESVSWRPVPAGDESP